MTLTGVGVNAETALRIGLVEEVVGQGKSLEAAMTMAQRVLGLSPQGVEYAKALIHEVRNGIPRVVALSVDRRRFVDLFSNPNQVEGVNAFLEMRPPVWAQC